MSEELCIKLGPELSGYHDGMLDEATRLQVEAHLQSCAACRVRLADYARVDRAVHALGTPLFEDRLREDLVAYARATIEDRGRGARRKRRLAELRSWRALVPLAAAASVAVLVLKLADGGFQSFSARRQPPPSATFESQVKSGVEADSQSSAMAFESGAPATAPPASSAPRDRLKMPGGDLGTAPAPDADGALSAPSDKRRGAAESRLADESPMGEPTPTPPAGERDSKDAATASGVAAQTTPPPPPLAKEEQEKAGEAPPPVAAEAVPEATTPTRQMLRASDQGNQAAAQSAPPAAAPPPPAPRPAPARGHLDPAAALSIATLALQVGDLTGARMALADLPTLPADSLTARAAVLALTLAERSQDLADCRAARERADALVEAVPSGALADTLRVRRAALPCPH